MDTTRAIIPGASVKVFSPGAGLSRTVTSNVVGGYVASELPLGTYSVTAEKEGFRSTTLTGLVALLENGKTLGTAELRSGLATLSLKGLSVGTHTLTAIYAGDQHHQGSVSQPLQQIVVTIDPTMPVPPGLGRNER